MSDTTSHPAPLPNTPVVFPNPQSVEIVGPLPVPVTDAALIAAVDDGVNVGPLGGNPKVFAGCFTFVASGSANETDANNGGLQPVTDLFDGSTILGFGAGVLIQSLTITAVTSAGNLDLSGDNVTVEMLGGTVVPMRSGQTMSWSTVERFASGGLFEINRVRVFGEALAIVHYTVSD